MAWRVLRSLDKLSPDAGPRYAVAHDRVEGVMPEDDYFKDDFHAYFWPVAAAFFTSLIGLDNDGLGGWVWLGLAGFFGLFWLGVTFLGRSFQDKRKTYQRAIPWAIWSVLGAGAGVGGFIGFKAGVAWFKEANFSPASQVLMGMLAIIIVQLFYINLELERIRKRPMPTNATPPL